MEQLQVNLTQTAVIPVLKDLIVLVEMILAHATVENMLVLDLQHVIMCVQQGHTTHLLCHSQQNVLNVLLDTLA